MAGGELLDGLRRLCDGPTSLSVWAGFSGWQTTMPPCFIVLGGMAASTSGGACVSIAGEVRDVTCMVYLACQQEPPNDDNEVGNGRVAQLVGRFYPILPRTVVDEMSTGRGEVPPCLVVCRCMQRGAVIVYNLTAI